MIQQAARTSIRSVHRTHEAPSFRKQFSDSGGLHFGEVLASVNAAEVRQIARKVKFVSHDGESSSLLQIKLRFGDQISRCEEVFHPFSN